MGTFSKTNERKTKGIKRRVCECVALLEEKFIITSQTYVSLYHYYAVKFSIFNMNLWTMQLYLIEDKLTEIGNDSVLGLEHSEISLYYSWIVIKKQYAHKRTEALGNFIGFCIWCLRELASLQLVNIKRVKTKVNLRWNEDILISISSQN